MLKRGQITLFVVLGVVIISALALGFYFRQQIASKEVKEEAVELTGLPPDLETLREEVEDCAKQVSDEALYLVGQQGGYFVLPKDSVQAGYYSVAFGVNNGQKTLASDDTLKDEIASYVMANLPECVDYSAYENLEITEQVPETSVTFDDEKTELEIDYKLTVQKEGNAYNLFEPYEVVLPLRVKKVYQSSSKIADDLVADSGDLDVNKMLSYGMDVDVYNIGDNFRVIAVKDKKQDAERNYEFLFGVGA